jgi:hypothetical protein
MRTLALPPEGWFESLVRTEGLLSVELQVAGTSQHRVQVIDEALPPLAALMEQNHMIVLETNTTHRVEAHKLANLLADSTNNFDLSPWHNTSLT